MIMKQTTHLFLAEFHQGTDSKGLANHFSVNLNYRTYLLMRICLVCK